MKIKTYVINLKDSVDRRKRALHELSKYPFMDYELVEAVDGRIMSQEDIDLQFDCEKFFFRREREVLPSEIGCTLSHRVCYRKFLNSNENVALILEDDVGFLDNEKNIKKLVKEIIEEMTEKPCVVTFTRHLNYYSLGKRTLGEYTLCRVRDALGTCAYLINRKAAEILLSIEKPYYVADDFLLMNKYNIRVKSVYPMLAIGASETREISSLILNDLSQLVFKKIPIYHKIAKEASRFYRRLLYVTGILRKREYKKIYWNIY